jgi:hypothetical protein
LDKETLFLKTYEDILVRLNLQDEYEILMISALLRKLLLDEYPLVHQINEKYRLKLIFEITEFTPILHPSLEFWSIQDGIDPMSSHPGRKQRLINLQEFISIIILRIRINNYSIQDLIKYEANITGAIHAGSAKDDKDIILSQISNLYSIGGLPAGIRQLKAISRVVLKAIEPLKLAILGSK